MKRITRLSTFLLIVGLGSVASADDPFWGTVHGMLNVNVDENSKLFGNTGRAMFADPGHILFNAAGNTIIRHDEHRAENLGGTVATQLVGGIAEREGPFDSPPHGLPTLTSTVVAADDPGFFVGANMFPVNYALGINFVEPLRYFDGNTGTWIAPTAGSADGEKMTAWDLNTNLGPVPSSIVTITGDAVSGNVSGNQIVPGITAPVTGGVSGIHGHLGYQLERGDGQPPEFGAYMLEVTLSMYEWVGGAATGNAFTDSDPIFVVFDNRSDQITSDPNYFESAVTAAQALPEPTTGMVLVVLGAGLLAARSRRRAARLS